ncbi:hypothetical protein HPB48_005084 [Haemaphysalis longicornis]|uniref:Uncharacterized protein n=1 Tax=Haemaphysalis longicornis TaxID=44386 RepID=A0A9J6FFJ3_HAELO|nr:hypothetical protein HPB48_005084 [Haemaphysalis longicornis]
MQVSLGTTGGEGSHPWGTTAGARPRARAGMKKESERRSGAPGKHWRAHIAPRGEISTGRLGSGRYPGAAFNRDKQHAKLGCVSTAGPILPRGRTGAAMQIEKERPEWAAVPRGLGQPAPPGCCAEQRRKLKTPHTMGETQSSKVGAEEKGAGTKPPPALLRSRREAERAAGSLGRQKNSLRGFDGHNNTPPHKGLDRPNAGTKEADQN